MSFSNASDPGSELAPSLLMVTREQGADRRYGLGRCLEPIRAELARRGWRVRYLTQEDLPPLQRRQREQWLARLSRWPWLRGRPGRQNLLGAWLERLAMGLHAARVARASAFRRVHLHDPWIAVGFWLGRIGARSGALRWGVTEHGFGSYARATQLDGLVQGPWVERCLHGVERAILQRADWVTLPTRLALERLQRDLGLSRTPPHWRVIPHARPVLKPMGRPAARAALGWGEESFMIVAVGRLVPLKRFDRLLEACAALAPSHPHLQLCLLGEGGEEGRLRELAERSGFGDRLIITAVEEVAPYLRAADLYVSTSRSESFGLANLEALGAGLPVLCTGVGGVPEVVGAGALLIDEPLEELAPLIESFIRAPERAERWRRAARRQAEGWPDVTCVGEAYVALYQE